MFSLPEIISIPIENSSLFPLDIFFKYVNSTGTVIVVESVTNDWIDQDEKDGSDDCHDFKHGDNHDQWSTSNLLVFESTDHNCSLAIHELIENQEEKDQEGLDQSAHQPDVDELDLSSLGQRRRDALKQGVHDQHRGQRHPHGGFEMSVVNKQRQATDDQQAYGWHVSGGKVVTNKSL